MKPYEYLTHGQREKRCYKCAFYTRNGRGCGGGRKGCLDFKEWTNKVGK